MRICFDCAKPHQVRHTCKAGHCTHCDRHLQSISDHKCPILKLTALSTCDLWRDIVDDGQRCDGCHALHFGNKNARGLREYKGADLSSDCYGIPQIERTTSLMLLKLAQLDIQSGETNCAICQQSLVDPQTGSEVASYTREYVDVFEKECTVWALVAKG